MTEYAIVTTNKVPADKELCSLSANLTDAGVEITAVSPHIEAFVKSVAIDPLINGGDYSNKLAGIQLYRLPPYMARTLDGCPILTELFTATSSVDEYGNRRKAEPNILWMYAKGLENGVTITFPQPAFMPGDIIEYLNRSMERVRLFHLKFIRKLQIKSVLLEKI